MGGTMTQDRTHEELWLLEELFAEESHCEMHHKKTSCTAAVTHVAVDCRRQFLVCSVAHAIIKKMIEQNAACIHCKQQASDCWKVVAV
jgi:hypothetical protein